MNFIQYDGIVSFIFCFVGLTPPYRNQPEPKTAGSDWDLNQDLFPESSLLSGSGVFTICEAVKYSRLHISSRISP